MNRIFPAVLALLVAATASCAQDLRPDIVRLDQDGMTIITTTPYPDPAVRHLEADRVTPAARAVELSAIDVVAGNPRFLFNPIRAFEYWPEYLYEYESVENSGLCDTSDPPALQQAVGPVAVLHAQNPATAPQSDSGGVGNGEDIEDAEPVSYAGLALFTAGTADRPSVSADHTEDLCGWMDRIGNSMAEDSPGSLCIATSRAIPARDLEFVRRVELNINPGLYDDTIAENGIHQLP
ncbi:MAG: hypothetical protein OXC91_15145 [Rhodobacteraceae bacterium]|nr:hypothetical protein [Paracoccaceae bacterium]